jgi:hypothetical protein
VWFWKNANRAAVAAVERPGVVTQAGRIRFRADEQSLRIKLPSGRYLSYPFPRLTKDGFDCDAVVFRDNSKGKWVDYRGGIGAYGGTWTENIVSGIARDLLVAAMTRLAEANYRTVIHVHDEIVCEMADGKGSLEEFKRLIETLPPWAIGLPIAAKVRNGPRFSKAEPAPKLSPICIHCQAKLGEGASADAHNGGRLHPQCVEAFLRARMVEEGIAWESPTTPTPPPAPPTEPSPPPAPPLPDEEPPPDPSNGRGGGNGMDYPHGERDDVGVAGREYFYRDARGKLHHKTVRYRTGPGPNDKQFPQYHPVNGRWVKGLPKGPPIPYRLPELLNAPAGSTVEITEGEHDAET